MKIYAMVDLRTKSKSLYRIDTVTATFLFTFSNASVQFMSLCYTANKTIKPTIRWVIDSINLHEQKYQVNRKEIKLVGECASHAVSVLYLVAIICCLSK